MTGTDEFDMEGMLWTGVEMARRLKAGDGEAFDQMAELLETNGGEEFATLMEVVVLALLPEEATAKLLDDNAEDRRKVIDMYTRRPRT